MKIYILGSYEYDGMDISNVYSTREKAEEANEYQRFRDDIHEFEVDPPNGNEKYEDFFQCEIDDRGIVWDSMARILPSEFIASEYFDKHGKFVRGLGRTIQEAKENAEKQKILSL